MTPLTRRWILCATMFALFGFMWGHFASQLPNTKENLTVDDRRFGLLLLADDVGTFAGQALATRMPMLLSSANLAPLVGVLVSLAAGAANAARTSRGFGGAMLVFGVVTSLFDVAINIQVVALGTLTGRIEAPLFHGIFSMGQLAGSGVGTLLTRLAWPFNRRVGTVAVSLAVAYALHSPLMPSEAVSVGEPSVLPPTADEFDDPEVQQDERSSAAPPQQSIRIKIVLLAIIGFLSSIGEGSLSEWSGIYLRQNLGTSFALANTAAFTYSLGMVVARLAGSWLAARIGIKAVLMSGALLCTASISTGLWIAQPLPFLWLTGVAAAGLANVTPLSMALLSRLATEQQAISVAKISLAQQLGFFSGPVLVGTLSGWLGLRAALAVLPITSLLIVLGAIPLRT